MYVIRIFNLLARSPAKMPGPRYRNRISVPKESKSDDPDIDFTILTDLGTIDILRNHIFRIFGLGPPPPKYVIMFLELKIIKN